MTERIGWTLKAPTCRADNRFGGLTMSATRVLLVDADVDPHTATSAAAICLRSFVT
jgi:hypothetical protein